MTRGNACRCRRLVGATKSGKTLSFTYNDEGIRTSKTVNGVTTNYYIDGSRIIAEETNGNITYYLYDSTGIIGFQYHASTYGATTWDTYFYEKNLQGDIVAIYNSNGVKLLSYSYDAWGNFTKAQHNSPTAVVINNPFTYRGYYYDKDIALYYLNARYYDSQTGRFVNADSALYHSMLGYNMFAYCYNNPVNFYDPAGESSTAFLSSLASFAALEPTIVGEILLVGATVVIGFIAIADACENVDFSFDRAEDRESSVAPPKSITESEEPSKEVTINELKEKKR